ncbi:MAG TPA: response regulator [Gemmatimonadaceae bacterium]|nr:response regulator [Gemmatimonadaceae bacterium]
MQRVLVVDDDRNMVKTLRDVLSFKGWQVGTAYSGEEAVDAATKEKFDVVLMDVKMPGMDGVDAFKAIKAQRPNTTVVLMTAYAAQDRLAEAERSGVWRVLSKPVNVPGLIELLAGALGSSRPVLLVDNDATFLKTMSEVLKLRGYATVDATSVDDATRLMTEQRPVAVLLHASVGQPLDETVEKVHGVGPSVAVILYSGKPETANEVHQRVPPDRVRAYLQKPFAIEEVMSVLDALRTVG